MRIVLLLDLDRRGPVERVARNAAARVPDRYYRRLLRVARAHHALDGFPRRSEASKRLFQGLVAASQTLHPVLLRGPRGSGRGACAEVLHHARHSTGPFLELSCDGLGEASQEAELFGERPVKGNASGGLIARSKDGTLVLHDLEHLSLAMQKRIAAIGKDRHLRIVATTSSSTEVLVASGRLLEDLASVFAGSVIDVPPLRERRQDLPEMISRVVGRDTFDRMTTPAIQALVAWDWPGGVAEFARELSRIQSLGARPIDTVDLDTEIVSHAVLMARPELLREVEINPWGSAPEGVAPAVMAADAMADGKPPITSLPTKYEPGRIGPWIPERSDWVITDDDPIDLDLYLRKALLRALAMAKGDRTQAARLAGVGKSTFYRKLRDWDLTGPETQDVQPRPPTAAADPDGDAEASPPA
jgi:DNA-binding NtrC family response regulator